MFFTLRVGRDYVCLGRFLGIYSYLILGLGLVGLLTKGWIVGVTILVLILVLVSVVGIRLKFSLSQAGSNFLWGLVVVQGMINLVGALGPELGFDALWYHLTLPKLWLEAGRIFAVNQVEPRLYYAVMPHLGEMLFTAAISLGGGETWAKLVQWAAGILAVVVTYRLALKYVGKKWATLAAVVFYSNPVVGWQSITAYVDLVRTFFEVLALYLLVEKQVYRSALILGLAISTKLLAVGSLPILLFLLWWQNKSLKVPLVYFLISIFTGLPWLLWAYLNTGNPLYPIFSGYPLEFAWGNINLLRLADPISPVYLGILPLFIWSFRKLPVGVAFYSLLSFGVWYLTPRTGGGRFLLPYLPAWSVVVAIVTAQVSDWLTERFVVGTIVAVAVISIAYRTIANAKYLPVVLGRQDKIEFVREQLNSWEKAGNLYYEKID